jgi:ketosteroid isomerase-like protein
MSNFSYATPDEAEQAFYEAFERGDIAALMAVWATQEEIVCVHPQGPRLVGHDAIEQSYKQIFGSGMQLRIEIAQSHQYHTQALAVHCVIEILTVQGERDTPPPLAAVNVFALTDDGWRMVSHHASAVPPAGAVAESVHDHTLH